MIRIPKTKTVVSGYKIYGSAMTNYIRYFYDIKNWSGLYDLCNCLIPQQEIKRADFVNEIIAIIKEERKISGIDGRGENGFMIVEDDGTDEEIIYYVDGNNDIDEESIRSLWNLDNKESDSVEYGKDGWISPDGKYYYCTSENHRYEAKRILKELGEDLSRFKKFYGTDYWAIDKYLQEIGWVKITNGEFLRFTENFHDMTITKKQLDFIFDYLEYFDRLDKPFECLCNTYQNYFELLKEMGR